ncbi:tetratricopeptide repeat protein [Geomonas oryzisoli]|uniref:Tetratricopeptide repeat protein n=1 Tax=Geomonas oryzisoli TaxID=2847992 RepID=A0ABX8J184_9BACT|nr:tetratricopeptide repeat protein [Geomonas oryzisoli]QWV92014.1 tetratricopeptide repeat protein [Geomonas oryzisoli]
MVEDALSFWTEIQRYEDMLAADAKSLCFAPLSDLYRKLGLLDDAVSVAQKGCAAHPEYALGFVALGNACYAKGMAQEARQALETAIELKPDHIQAMKVLSQLYVELGEVALARQVLGQLLTRDPEDMESSMLLSSIASAPASSQASEPEEEVLEELEIIEELEEFVEEPAAEVAASPSQPPAAAAAVAVPPSADAAEDIWAIEDLEEVSETPASDASQPRGAVPDPLTTATLAELYVSQGFLEKAMGIYRELIAAHPDNQQYRLRCEELVEQQQLQQAASAQQTVAAPPVVPAAPVVSAAPAAPVAPAEPAVAAAPAASAVSAAPAVSAPVAFDAHDGPAAIEVPITVEEATAPAAFAGMDSPAQLETAPLEQPQLQDEAPADEDLESSLQRWLENIRRRKDGV